MPRSFEELVHVPARLGEEVRPYVPSFRYLVDDLSQVTDEALRTFLGREVGPEAEEAMPNNGSRTRGPKRSSGGRTASSFSAAALAEVLAD